MKGGFLETISQTLSNAWNTTTQAATNALNYSKQKSQDGYNYVTAPATTNTSTPITSYGGKKKRNTKKYKGGYKNNISITNLASHSASFSNGKTAQPHNWVGGKSKKKYHKKKKH